jgi:SEC-C motif
MTSQPDQAKVGLVFLARGLHDQWQHAFQRFIHSYDRFATGTSHRLYVVFKGYTSAEHQREAERMFLRIDHVPIHTHDRDFDIGAYKRAAGQISEPMVCFLNSKSEILCADWLRKMTDNLERPGVGLVGNTGSFASIGSIYPAFPDFPNIHIRTNAFLLRRDLFCAIADTFDIRSKYDCWMFESGPNSLTRQVLRKGLKSLVVGRDGRGYEPSQWPQSETYRSRTNANVLIADDEYRAFPKYDRAMQVHKVDVTWGPFLDPAQNILIERHVQALAATPRPRLPVETSSGTPTRNGPCPCGSGQRYKQCHGSLRDSVRILIGDEL